MHCAVKIIEIVLKFKTIIIFSDQSVDLGIIKLRLDDNLAAICAKPAVKLWASRFRGLLLSMVSFGMGMLIIAWLLPDSAGARYVIAGIVLDLCVLCFRGKCTTRESV